MLRTPKRSLSQQQINSSFKQGCLYILLIVNRIKFILCNKQGVKNVVQERLLSYFPESENQKLQRFASAAFYFLLLSNFYSYKVNIQAHSKLILSR